MDTHRSRTERLDTAAIDALDDLEPVYEHEAGDGYAELCTDVEIDCPTATPRICCAST